MTKQGFVIIADYTAETSLNLQELCEICGISVDVLNELVRNDIVHPGGNVPEEWLFDLMALQRIKRALRLRRDLEVNLAGVAVVLDLLDQLDELRQQIDIMERHRG